MGTPRHLWVFMCNEHKMRIESADKQWVDASAEAHWQLYPACRPLPTAEDE